MQLTQGRITAGRLRTRSPDDPSGWVMPTYGIVYYEVPGPLFRPYSRVPFRGQSIQVEFFGTDLRTAGELYRMWHAAFFPIENNRSTGFIAKNCAISSIEEVSSPAGLYQNETDWPRVVTAIMVKYSEVPTNLAAAVVSSADLAAQAASG
jgi:hypothetical protein